MATEREIELAIEVYEAFCKALDSRGWRYQKEDDKLIIKLGVNGDDIPMDLLIIVDVKRQMIRLISFLPVTMPEDKLIDGAIATSVINRSLPNGCFEYDVMKGATLFRLTVPFFDNVPEQACYEYVVDCACAVIDQYNDRLDALAKGKVSIGEFIQNNEL